MNILQADLASHVGSLFCSAEQMADTAVIRCRTIHQTDTIRAAELFMNQADILLSLRQIHKVGNNAAGHGQQAVMDTGLLVSRMKHRTETAILIGEDKSGNYTILNQVLMERLADLFTQIQQLIRECTIHCGQSISQYPNGLISQCLRPGTDQTLF